MAEFRTFRSERGPLVVAGVAAVLASVCCLGPLGLLLVGVSGAWIASLTGLEPYRPVLLGVATVSLALSYRRVFRPASQCRPGEVCALPAVRTTTRVLFLAVAALLFAAAVFPWVAPLFY